MSKHKDWQRGQILAFAETVVMKGFDAFIAESGTHGFYTNGDRVVSFQIDVFTILLSGNYRPHLEGGTGWRISDDKDDPTTLIEDAIKMTAPRWATTKPDLEYTTKDQYLATYDKSSRFTQVVLPTEIIKRLLEPALAVASKVELKAHELWSDGEEGWTSNDRFTIGTVEDGSNGDLPDLVAEVVLGRLEVFKENYLSEATVTDIERIDDWDLSNDDLDLTLEIEGNAFIDIEITVSPIRKIKYLAEEIERELFTTSSSGDYYLVVDLITKLADACHEYEGETEDWLCINEGGHATPDSLIVGAHWHGAEWHGGQSCPVYAMISSTGQIFSPGMTNGPEPESPELDVFNALKDVAEKHQKKQAAKNS